MEKLCHPSDRSSLFSCSPLPRVFVTRFCRAMSTEYAPPPPPLAAPWACAQVPRRSPGGNRLFFGSPPLSIVVPPRLTPPLCDFSACLLFILWCFLPTQGWHFFNVRRARGGTGRLRYSWAVAHCIVFTI